MSCTGTGTTCDGRVWEIVIGLWSKNYNPNLNVEQMFWRYTPPIPTWFFVFAVACQYRRNLLISNDMAIVQKNEQTCQERVSIKFPTCYKVYHWCVLVLNHSIVLVTFLFYFLCVFNLRRTFMNGITLMIILFLLIVYFSKGLEKMLKWWKLLSFYQAFVLSLLLLTQFCLEIISEEQ